MVETEVGELEVRSEELAPLKISRKVRQVRKEMKSGWRAGVRKPPEKSVRTQLRFESHAHTVESGSRQSPAAEENSRKVRKVREVINWWSLAAEVSINLFRRTARPSRWIAGVSDAEVNDKYEKLN